MNLFYVIVVVLLAIFIVYQGRTAIPRIVSFLVPGKRSFYFEEDLQTAKDKKRLEKMRPILEKIEALGFTRLGIMVEKQPLWAKGTRELSLASSPEKAFASIGFRRNEPSYFFYTPFTGGQIIITAYNSFRHFERNDFFSSVVSSGEPGEMLETHKKKVAEFTAKGLTPYRDYTRESLIEATLLFYNASHPRLQLRTAGMINLIYFLVLVFVFVLLLRALVS